MIEELWASTVQLHQRFNIQDGDVRTRLRKLAEEFYEFNEAVLTNELVQLLPEPPDHAGTQDYLDKIAEELADVLVVMLATAERSEVDLLTIKAAIRRVVEKNDAKNLDTHELVNGIIKRKEYVKNNVDGTNSTAWSGIFDHLS